MTDLTYLMEEICCGLEVHFSSRTGGQYRKTAFILCDDYTELTSKLFLLGDNANWSDKASGRFKNYHRILSDVDGVVGTKAVADLPEVKALHSRMKPRRDRRNQFFHATHLLDLSVTARGCVEAYLDLLRYGEVLFGADWQAAMASTRSMEIMAVLLKLDMAAFSDGTMSTRINEVLASVPRNITSGKSKGLHIALHPDDLHLRMSLTWGGPSLLTDLSSLLPP